MDIDPISIELRCLFCDAVLQGPDDSEFESGDLIECLSCGEGNDYDSVIEVAKEKGVDQMTNEVEAQLDKTFKKLFK